MSSSFAQRREIALLTQPPTVPTVPTVAPSVPGFGRLGGSQDAAAQAAHGRGGREEVLARDEQPKAWRTLGSDGKAEFSKCVTA